MSEPQKEKGLRPELRILVASLLSMFVIIAWAKFFAPKAPPPSPQTSKPAVSSPANPGPAAAPPPGTGAYGTSSIASAATPPAAAKSATQERNIVVENDLYRLEFSNRGGRGKKLAIEEI